MSEFYVSDSFSLTLPAGTSLYHYPGPFNSSKVWGPSEQVYVDFEAGELGVLAFRDSLEGMNVDIQFGFYDVSVTGVATPYGPPIPFAAPFGTASNGQVMHASARFGQYAYARRFPKRPIKFQGGTGSITATQLGPIFKFNYSISTPVTVEYQYFMQGVCA